MKSKIWFGIFLLIVLLFVFTSRRVHKKIIPNEAFVFQHFADFSSEDLFANREEYDFSYEFSSDVRQINYTQSVDTLLKALNVSKKDIEKIATFIDINVINVQKKSYIKMLYSDDINAAQAQSQVLPPYVEEDKLVRSISYFSFPIKGDRYIFSKNAEGFDFKKNKITISRVPVYVKSKIEGSLYDSFITKEIPHEVFQTFVNIYSFDVDFQRDIRNNDKFEIIYDKLINDEGVQVGLGRVLYSKLSLQQKKGDMEYFILDRTSTQRKYYDRLGNAVAKTFMKTPVNGARISSRFGMRKHPILGYSRLHSGMDFSAPSGTAIYAAADGVIDFIGWNGGSRKGYGRYTIIKHNSMYSTAYAHQSRFKNGLRKGSKVRQGQVIGYVGSTGHSTGPHLHYEVHKYGKKINPAKVTSLSTGKAKGTDKTKLNANIKFVDNILSSNENTK